MPHVYRFFVPSHTAGEKEIALSSDEAHHALRVVRVRQGERVVLFDGCGRELLGIVARADIGDFRVAIDEVIDHPKPARTLVLAQAWLNREKSLEDLIRRGTELGVSCFRFFEAQHSERKPRLHEKWVRLAIESCKQCGRLWLPTFEVKDGLDGAFEGMDGPVLMATQDHPPVPLRTALSGQSRVTILVGPEGGFSEAEMGNALGRGAIPISLGAATFRSEMAGSLASALALYEMGELGPTSS